MTDREKLIDLLCKAHSKAVDEILSDDISYAQQLEIEADHLLANSVTITPEIPGPDIADPNIMELCFHNGERHMKERILTKLKDISAEILFEERISGEMKVVTFEQVIQILEDL